MLGDQQLNDGDRQKDRHGGVAAGFDFECRRDPFLKLQTSGAEQGKHRGGVGGAHHRAHQQAFKHAEIQQPS